VAAHRQCELIARKPYQSIFSALRRFKWN
jgi:hypothetical protein